MKRTGVLRFGAVFTVAMALVFGTLGSGAAQAADSSITIHNRICPVGYNGNDIFGDCHGNPQTSNLDFSISGPASDSGATDADGNITFSGLPSGTYNISGGVPGEFASTVVYCSVEDDPNNTIAVTSTDTGVSIDLPASTNVVCDWYNIPFDLKGDGGTTSGGTTSGGTTTTTTLPATGAGTVAGQSGTVFYLGGLLALVLGGFAVVMRRRAMNV
ncbi:MAG TPA: hypothetical protein VFL82_05165 [Thermomicrobiales bacterium]|jgi:hypothetical protein|nr:hypothetical protein [Thermomicrobiales bacterium]